MKYEQMKDIRELIISLQVKAKIRGEITEQEEKAIEDYMVEGESAKKTLEEYLRNGIK